MQFVITAYDGEGMLDKRMEVRPLHLEGMERLKDVLQKTLDAMRDCEARVASEMEGINK
ncbi:MAG: hypothetical protein IJR69_11260 [Bacteroidaceae bacterium]|nr:hypothetical protein [Bacteroidaceae bacterium]